MSNTVFSILSAGVVSGIETKYKISILGMNGTSEVGGIYGFETMFASGVELFSKVTSLGRTSYIELLAEHTSTGTASASIGAKNSSLVNTLLISTSGLTFIKCFSCFSIYQRRFDVCSEYILLPFTVVHLN